VGLLDGLEDLLSSDVLTFLLAFDDDVHDDDHHP
jgi:hypothetical protein